VVVQISNGSLVGNYAFSFAGKNSGTAYASAGSITFDGGGNITGGSEDVNAVAATSLAITGGTYHIGIDGRGNATVQTSGGAETWQIVIKDNTKAFVMRADAGTTGSGTLYLQDVTKFAIGSVNGNYALQLSGPAAGQTGSAAIASAFAANGAGGISGGKLDASAGTTVSTALSANGLYTAPAAATGRGTLTLASTYGTQNFAYYLVDATRAVLVETDAGFLRRQLRHGRERRQYAGSPGIGCNFHARWRRQHIERCGGRERQRQRAEPGRAGGHLSRDRRHHRPLRGHRIHQRTSA
jgi:hypothetical protein